MKINITIEDNYLNMYNTLEYFKFIICYRKIFKIVFQIQFSI